MLNILIPMSGRGSRFKDAGYQLPKPLIDVNGKPMIQRVIENLGFADRYIFLVLREHYEFFDLANLLPSFCGPNICEIIVVEQVTQGAACTCLLATDKIDNTDELIIANSDQLVEWNSSQFMQDMSNHKADGGIVTFTAHESKWSFAKLDPNTNLVIEVAEKNPISDCATAGIYWFKHGHDFVMAANSMISKNIRTNNEFYVCPIFNELISNDKKIYTHHINNMYGLGTPEDLSIYLNK